MNEYVRALAEGGDPADLGGKGASLARLVAAGLPVPDGFVVTVAAFRAYAAAGSMPADVAAAVDAAYAALGRPAVAVRSSATAEDLAEASFAGQQDTFLDVSGADEVLAAVERCWASLVTERAMVYRARHGGDDAATGGRRAADGRRGGLRRDVHRRPGHRRRQRRSRSTPPGAWARRWSAATSPPTRSWSTGAPDGSGDRDRS